MWGRRFEQRQDLIHSCQGMKWSIYSPSYEMHLGPHVKAVIQEMSRLKSLLSSLDWQRDPLKNCDNVRKQKGQCFGYSIFTVLSILFSLIMHSYTGTQRQVHWCEYVQSLERNSSSGSLECGCLAFLEASWSPTS